MIAQAKCTETMGNPAQALACRVRVGGMRVSGSNDLHQKNERGIVREPVFSKDRVERNFYFMMSQFTARHIVDSPFANTCSEWHQDLQM